tara:strand:+ start:1060 stop:1452 length:393 start_codon:yes stop_codon:yes gene_type:complete
MSEKYDYKYEKRKSMIKNLMECRAALQSETIPMLDEMVGDAFRDSHPSDEDWMKKAIITLTPEQASRIEGYFDRFRSSTEKLMFFLNFIEERGLISLWEEYQQEDAKLESYGSAGAKTPKALLDFMKSLE